LSGRVTGWLKVYLYAIGLGSNRCHGRYGRPADVLGAAIDRFLARLGGDGAR